MSAPPETGDTTANLTLVAAGLSHPGRERGENEDAFGSFPDARLFVVADGMGGHNAGEVAAAMAVVGIDRFFRAYHGDPLQPWPYPVDRTLSLAANLLRGGIKVTNDKIRAEADADRSRARMGTTVVAMAIGEEQLAVAHADVVTRSLGSKEELEPDVHVGSVQQGDVYLLCSDGLWGVVRDDKIAAVLRANPDLPTACQKLVDAANEAGGPDNVTALLVRAGG